MDLDIRSNRDELIACFPQLADDPHFKITSPQTVEYNCIAWAMGFEKRWVACFVPSSAHDNDGMYNHIRERFVWWPKGVEMSMRKEALVDAFRAVGFEITDNQDYEDEYDKAVLYERDGNWTHASRIISDSVEHSKFGESWDGCHGRDRFSDSNYGNPFAYMKRPHRLKSQYIDSHPLTYANIRINESQLNKARNILRSLK